MNDAAYFCDHAERYRKLAAAFRDRPISARLARLAEEFDVEARDLPRQRACTIRRATASGHTCAHEARRGQRRPQTFEF